MTDVNNNQDDNTDVPPAPAPEAPNLGNDTKEFKDAVAAAVAEQLKDLKAKVDNAYSQRDTVVKEAEELKQKLSEQQTEKLKAEGKVAEALELELSQERAKSEVLAKRNIELTRDLEIKSVLNGYDFRSDKASKMAFSEITAQLVQTEQGSWQGKNGDKVEKIIGDFMSSEDNEFLLKPKANSGGGHLPTSPTSPPPSSGKSLFQMTQKEVLEMAATGKLNR